MAYFDSPKNQALWKKEIEKMKEEREQRRRTGFKGNYKARGMEDTQPGRKKGARRITFKELEQIVRRKKGLALDSKAERQPERRERGREREFGGLRTPS